jgi:hypothetical protein
MMVNFGERILKFGEQGEKTGWTYINIPADIAQQLKPGYKKAFRVKGKLGNYPIAGVALTPMGGGNFIMALKAELMKAIGKHPGAMIDVMLEADDDFKFAIPPELQECLDDEPEAQQYFNSLAESHRGYFIKWIDSAKTEATRASRLAHTLNALTQKMNYGEMIRSLKNSRL